MGFNARKKLRNRVELSGGGWCSEIANLKSDQRLEAEDYLVGNMEREYRMRSRGNFAGGFT